MSNRTYGWYMDHLLYQLTGGIYIFTKKHEKKLKFSTKQGIFEKKQKNVMFFLFLQVSHEL